MNRDDLLEFVIRMVLECDNDILRRAQYVLLAMSKYTTLPPDSGKAAECRRKAAELSTVLERIVNDCICAEAGK